MSDYSKDSSSQSSKDKSEKDKTKNPETDDIISKTLADREHPTQNAGISRDVNLESLPTLGILVEDTICKYHKRADQSVEEFAKKQYDMIRSGTVPEIYRNLVIVAMITDCLTPWQVANILKVDLDTVIAALREYENQRGVR